MNLLTHFMALTK